MADKPGYSLVPGDGGRASGLIRRRIVEEGGGGGSGGFLDLSLGSIYNNTSSVADDGFSPVARTLLPAAAVTSVVAASTSLHPPPASARAPAFALGIAASAVTAANGILAGNALSAATNQGQVAPAPSALLPLFARGGIGAVLVPVAVQGKANAYAAVPAAASDSGATPPAHGSKGAVPLLGASLPSSAPPPPNRKAPRGRPNRKAPRGRRGIATGGSRRRSGATGDDAADADAAPTDGGGSALPPFPWATKTAGAHLTLAELIEQGIASVEGEVRCKRCDVRNTISYDIRAKFEELFGFIVCNVEAMRDRAPTEWMYPALSDCDKCGQKNSLRPVIAAEKWKINWMFLLLSQTLGLCTLEQLKHFCARTRQHRTGAKDRVLYSTYMELCNQLCPGGPFDMASDRKNRTRPFA